MALVSVITAQEGEDYDEAARLIAAMKSDGGEPTLNSTKLEDFDGRIWYGYDYDGASWWITKSMAAEGESGPYEFTEQKDPSGL